MPSYEKVAGLELEQVMTLVEKGFNVNAVDEFGFTPIMWAIINGDTKIAKFLFRHGAKFNKKIPFGKSPLYLAVCKDRKEILNFLIKKGKNLDKQVEGLSPLMLATILGNKAIVQKLINKGAAVNARNEEGKTALDYAVGGDTYPNGFDLSIPEVDHETPFAQIIDCVKKGNDNDRKSIVELLLSHGAEINGRNRMEQPL